MDGHGTDPWNWNQRVFTSGVIPIYGNTHTVVLYGVQQQNLEPFIDRTSLTRMLVVT